MPTRSTTGRDEELPHIRFGFGVSLYLTTTLRLWSYGIWSWGRGCPVAIGEAKANPSAATLPRTLDGQAMGGISMGRTRRRSRLGKSLSGPPPRALRGRGAHQRDGAAMPHELGQLRVIAIPQREHVAATLQHDRLPPAVVEVLLRNHQMTRRDLVPAARQAGRDRQLLIFADGGSRFCRQRRKAARGCRWGRRQQSRRSRALAATDRFLPKSRATRPAARLRPLLDGGIGGATGSWHRPLVRAFGSQPLRAAG